MSACERPGTGSGVLERAAITAARLDSTSRRRDRSSSSRAFRSNSDAMDCSNSDKYGRGTHCSVIRTSLFPRFDTVTPRTTVGPRQRRGFQNVIRGNPPVGSPALRTCFLEPHADRTSCSLACAARRARDRVAGQTCCSPARAALAPGKIHTQPCCSYPRVPSCPVVTPPTGEQMMAGDLAARSQHPLRAGRVMFEEMQADGQRSGRSWKRATTGRRTKSQLAMALSFKRIECTSRARCIRSSQNSGRLRSGSHFRFCKPSRQLCVPNLQVLGFCLHLHVSFI